MDVLGHHALSCRRSEGRHQRHPSHICQTTTAAGEVAAHAEERKCSKYSGLPFTHDFIPVAIETSGVMQPQSLHFLRELGT